MLNIHHAKKADIPAIFALLQRLDTPVPKETDSDFWVAKQNGKIVGVARLEEYKDFYFLSFVGTDPEHQRQGIARHLLEKIFKDLGKDVYLYTIIPEFFERLGFKITLITDNLPSKENLGCEQCEPDKCVCMVKKL